MANKTFIISDLMLFNDRRRRECGYNSFEEMNEEIIKRWNKTVGKEDSVILMGKVGEGSFEQMKDFFSKLNGYFTINSKSLNNVFSKKEWRQIGISFFWGVSMLYETSDNKKILYLISPIKNLNLYKGKYDLIIVDSTNPIKKEPPIDDILMSADAKCWGYTPLDTEELYTIYKNMLSFLNMKESESRSEVNNEQWGN